MAFVKGKSGNPKGRPKLLTKDGRSLSEIAKEHTDKAIETLVAVMDDGESDAARVSAANSLLDRAWGRPKQEMDVDLHINDMAAIIEARRQQVANGKQA